MYNYKQEDLKALQNIELGILKKLDDICMRHGIEYFVVFGTALGTVRHKGFIPWDDDIDVGMMRDEYAKLKKVPTDEWGDCTLSDAYDKTNGHVLIYPQIYKQGTVFETEYHNRYDKKPVDHVLPIWIDIFIYDYVVSADEVKRKYKKANLLRKLFYYSKYGTRVHSEDSIGRKISCIGKDLSHKVLSVRKGADLSIYNKYVRMVANKNGEYITTYDTSVLKEIVNSVIPYNEMFPTIRVPFEDIEVNIPKCYDKMLKQIYGDYMKLPPAEKRINHPPNDDVRIVVGYQAQKVIDIVNSYRRDLMFCFNYDYINTGTASSFCKGLVGAKEYVISIDGDVLFHPDDFKRFISKEDECIAGCSPEISDPVYMKLDDGVVSEFSRVNGDVQWAGLAIMDVNRIVPDEKHIYQILERMLPMKYMLIRSQEINTIGDYEKAIRWQANGYER